MSVSIPYPTLGTGIADSTKIDSNFNQIVTKFGNITNADIQSGAGIDINKLSASYEYMNVRLMHSAGSPATPANVWPAANTAVDAVPIFNDSQGNWTVVGGSWLCTDCGSGTAQFRVKWAYYSGGAITGVTNITPATVISNASAINQGNLTISTSTLTFDANARSLILTSEVDEANTLTDDNSFIVVSLTLKRQIGT